MHGILQIGIITFFCHSLYVVFLRHQSMKAGKSMKKRFVSLLVALSITLTFLPIGAVAAAPIKIGNLKYTVNADGKSVTVSGTSRNPKQLTIESSISDGNGNSYTVTKIGMGAFNSTLEEVTLPPTLDEIEDSAFFKCSSLTEITIPEGVTKIGTNAFYGCSQLTSITIPSTIKNMDTAFPSNPKLSQVTLTNGIYRISSSAFKDCTGLTEIKIPTSVYEICSDAFNGCTGLTSVTLEKGINIINRNAFKDCTKLNDVKYNGHKTDWENVRVNIAGNDTLTSRVQYLCDINFDLNGGTINGSSTMATQTVYSNEKLGTAKCYPNDQPFVVPTDPVREGYTFLGWYTQAEGGTKYTFTEAVSSNITLYAHWNAHSHTVTLENDENKETNSYDYGSSVSVPTPTKKTGYNFNHWEVTVPDGETAPSLNGPDENGNYSFSMPDYDITLTAKWTQKDVIDPDVDLKFDAATGEVTSNNAKVNADDIINRKFYDDKGNEVPGEKLNDRGLPTEPGDYIVKVDVKETENTAPANQITGNQIKWSYKVPQKEEKVTYTLSLLGGIAKVNGKDTTINDNGNITIEKGATVEVTFDKSILSDAQTFDQWTIKPASVLNANATETDKAITWAVENDLLKAAKNNGETYEATDPVSRTEVIKAWNQVQAFKK